MLLCLKDACIKIDKIISISRAQTALPNFTDEESDGVICNVLNILLDGYVTPVTIFYDSLEERDRAYTFAIECITEFYKG